MAIGKNNNLDEEVTIHCFYKIVLSWDYNKLKKQRGGENPSGLKKVKNKYKDVDDYLSVFEPLLFEEVKAQIIQGKNEEDETICTDGIVTECSEVNEFHKPKIICSNVEKISQNDLLLLSNKKYGEGNNLPNAYAFALVEHRQQDKVKVRMFLNGEVRNLNIDDLETCQRLINMRLLVSEGQKYLHILKICSLSTIVREYVALRSISTIPFKNLILGAEESDHETEDRAWKISKPLMEFIESSHNKSQLDAIKAGLSRKPFVLIQGPPGTGKTQTILGILSAILHATPARMHSKSKLSEVKRGPELPIHEKYIHWVKASPWLYGNNPRDEVMPIDGDDGFYPTTFSELKPEVVNSSRKYRVRVLVCAPSNSALDEIVLRLLKTGIHDENDRVYNPKIVRIGVKAHDSVKSVSMDNLVEQKLAGMNTQSGDKQKQGSSAKDKDGIRASILDEAVIVFSTLSFSGSEISKLNRSFDVVIIDEAAQAVEPATLIPLANGCKQVFLVGDPVQLPATVISTSATSFGYDMSLFKRFQTAGYPVTMLKTQYRMHPEIRSFPSKEFYDGALEDGPDVTLQTKRKWHTYRCFGPFCFFDIHEGKESEPSGKGSWVNVDEVDFVLALYRELVTRYPELKESSQLAIISPYAHQVKLFQERFRMSFGVESDKVVDIKTVDGFQGREKTMAIFSCVRASKDKGIGFVDDFRRMNVGITRARSSVLVVGSASTLKRGEHWKNLIESAEQRKTIFQVSKPYTDFFSDANLKQFEVMEAMPARLQEPLEDMDIGEPLGTSFDDADQGLPEEPDWGGGDAEGFDGGADDD